MAKDINVQKLVTSDVHVLDAVVRLPAGMREVSPSELSIFSMSEKELDAWLTKNREWLGKAYEQLELTMRANRAIWMRK